jgi:hypothetical protein
VARRKTLSRREQRQAEREVREHYAKHPTELPPELAGVMYAFVMGWQPIADNDNEQFRVQLSGLLDMAMDWAYERGLERARPGADN